MILFLILLLFLHGSVHAGVITEITWSKCSVTCGDGFQCFYDGEIPNCRPCQIKTCLTAVEVSAQKVSEKVRLKMNSQIEPQDGTRESKEWSQWGPCCPVTPQKAIQKRQLKCSYGDSVCSSTPFESRPCKLQFEGNPYGYIKRRRRDSLDQPPTESPYALDSNTLSSEEVTNSAQESNQDLDLNSVEKYLVGRVNTKPKD